MPPRSDARPCSSNWTGRFLKHISAASGAAAEPAGCKLETRGRRALLDGPLLLARALVVRRRRRRHRRLAPWDGRLFRAWECPIPFGLRLLRPLRHALPPFGSVLLAAVAPAAERIVELVSGLAKWTGLRSLARPAGRGVVVQVPARFAVQVLVRVQPQRPDDHPADEPRQRRRDSRAGRLLVEGRELVGEARHRAADARTARVHAATDVVDRAARGDVAVDDRAPAADLDEALWIAVLLGERAFLVVGAADAVPVHRLAEQPGGTPELVELRKRSETLQEVEDRRDGLREIV